MEHLLQCLLAGAQARKPAPAVTTGSSDIESLLQSLLPGNLAPVTGTRLGPMRRDWATVVCFSCGRAGHSATRCPDLNETTRISIGTRPQDPGGGEVQLMASRDVATAWPVVHPTSQPVLV